jgi:hypothetical protein
MELIVRDGFWAGVLAGMAGTLTLYGLFAVAVGFHAAIQEARREESRRIADAAEDAAILRALSRREW